MSKRGMFRFGYIHEYNGEELVSGDKVISIGLSYLRDGLMAHMSGNNLKVLLALISFSNKDGMSFPSQSYLADITGLSRATVNRSIGDLEEIIFNGMPLVSKKTRRVGDKTKSTYRINHFELYNSHTDINDLEEVEETVEEELEEFTIENSRDFINYFRNRYEEKYGQAYVPNWGRDGKNIKEKIIKHYDSKTMKAVIDFVIDNYETKWANPNFRTPTLGMFYTWIFNKALDELQNETKTKEQLAIDIEKQREEDESDIALELF